MTGNISPEEAPHNRYIPRGHALSWWMLVVTTGDEIPLDRLLGRTGEPEQP